MAALESKNSLFGAPSLIVIFGVLFLTVLALLTAERMNTGKRASQLSAERVSERYAAECEAEEILAALREGVIPEAVSEDDDVYEYSVQISDAQRFEYEAIIEDGGDYSVQRHLVTTVPTGEEEFMDLWDGDFDIGEDQ